MALTQRTFLSSSLFIFLGMFFTLSMFFMKEQSYVYSTEHLCNRTSIGRKFLMSPVISSTHAKCDRWKRLSESVQNCISDKLRSVKSGELWFYVSPIVETCATLLRDVLNTTFLSNKDDVKGFIGKINFFLC